MKTIETIAELRATLAQWRQAGERVALVPTMGNLHAGHLQLVEKARAEAERVVVSIFVNPLQFGDAGGGDFDRYPRTFSEDRRKLSMLDAAPDALFSPSVAEVYPGGFEQETRVEVPVISNMLCGAFRPGHFVGVATIVAKLFNMVQPDVALFGEKDYQQLQVIRRLAADLCFPVEIIGLPTVREQSGLAMSSRNQYLSAEEREHAAVLYQTLLRAQQQIASGDRDLAAIQAQASARLSEAGFRPEYVELRRQQDLLPASDQDRELVMLVAAWLGEARLIDNILLTIAE
ncbi:MAG: pantoate--beta-alanine ligase [Gammaproteobacteria bacterium]|nr:pantoate--beta-alanine ligase [Gammaproteobacteria bacterium]